MINDIELYNLLDKRETYKLIVTYEEFSNTYLIQVMRIMDHAVVERRIACYSYPGNGVAESESSRLSDVVQELTVELDLDKDLADLLGKAHND